MPFEPLDSVVLLRDLPEHGLKAGDLGAIVHGHAADRFEVEFVRGSGQTQAVVTLGAADLRPISDRDLVSVRTVRGQ
jgi:hypothetical protein